MKSFSFRWLPKLVEWIRGTRRSQTRCRAPFHRLWMENLEDRLAPATIMWNAGSGNWDDPTKWTGGNVPGPGDDAVIDTNATAATITILSSDAESVNSLTTGANDQLTISGGSLMIAATSNLAGALSMTDGSLTVTGTGALFKATGATTIPGASLYALAGATLSLPKLTNYSSDQSVFQADGAGSVLDVSALATVTQQSYWDVTASTGGQVDLSGLASLTSTQGIVITDTGNSSILDTKLTSLDGVDVMLDGTDAHVADSWTKLTDGNLTVTGGMYMLPKLTDVDGSSLIVQTSGSLALPKLTSFSSDQSLFQADGAGSMLNLSGLVTITQQNYWDVAATSGGTVNLTSLTSLTSTQGIAIFDTGNSSIFDGSLTALSDVSVTLDGTDAHVADSWTTFTGGGTVTDANLTVTGGSYTLPGLTDVDGSDLETTTGGTLVLSKLKNYAPDGNTFQADGAGSVLSLSALTTVTQQSGWFVTASNGGDVSLSGLTTLSSTQGVYFNALTGGQLDLGGLTSLGGTPPAGTIITDTGGSTILAGNLNTVSDVDVTVDGTGTWATNSITNASNGTYTLLDATSGNGVTINFPTPPQGLQGLNVYLSLSGSYTGATTVIVPAGITANIYGGTFVGGTIVNVGSGTTLNLSGATFSGGATFNVGSGATLVISSDTLSGGGVFNVSPGATVDLTSGIFSGTLTGTGTGTVELTESINIGIGGLTLNFAGTMFQWTGGVMLAALGDVTNQGTLNLVGSNVKGIFQDGILDNFGTIIQTGGDLELHGDSQTPTTLENESGAFYLIDSDCGIENSGGTTALSNAGTMMKTGGTGTSDLSINGAISNTGIMEADSGTLFLDANSISQVSGNTLTGGVWNAVNGATLEFPNGTAITTNAGNISLSGSGATITGLAPLASNSGSFSLTNGAIFTTAGNLSNSGTLTVGSALTVSGNFSQSSGGTFDEQIGGTPASQQFGQTTITGSATLAGTFNSALVNGFSPGASQQYGVISFAHVTGNFASFTGLSPLFTESLNPTALVLSTSAGGGGGSVDLAATSVTVTAPTMPTAGQQVTVNWQVTDQGSANAAGTWQDSVYLSITPAITSSSILLGTAQHSGGLNATDFYTGTLAAPLPALATGPYYVLVQVDSLYQVSDSSRVNNTLAANSQVNLSLPTFDVGIPLNDSFAAADQNHYYQVTVPAGGTVSIALTSAASSGATALYVSQGQLPTPFNFDFAAALANQPNQTVLVPQVASTTTYDVLVHSVSGNAATATFTLTATQSAALTVSSVPSTTSGNGGNATVEIDGTNFAANITASLTLGGAIINATSIQYVNASRIFAVFNLNGAAIGAYTLSLQQNAQSATAPTSFQVVAATSGSPLQFTLNAPSLVRAGRVGVVYVTVTNVSNNDAPAPLLILTSDAATLNLPADPVSTLTSLTFLAASPTGQADTLTAGESVTVAIDFQSAAINGIINFQLSLAASIIQLAVGSCTNELSEDPNALIGPAGSGPQRYVETEAPLGYTVQFENDGTAAAQSVTVTEALDANLDWSTFELGSFGFGAVNVSTPAGLTQYQTTIAYQNTDSSSLNVQTSFDFNVQTGILTASFTSLDPATGEAPTGVFDGFLPPENGTGVGEGYVQYTVQPKASLATGAVITQQASVVFDTNVAINTNTTTNTIDAGYPADQLVVQAPAQAVPGGKFTVTVHADGANGQLDPLATGSVALLLSGSPTGGVLSGAVTVPLVNGVATFNNLSLNLASSTAYTLSAASSSDLFNAAANVQVVAAPTFKVTLAPVTPGNTSAGQPFKVTVSAVLKGQPDTAYAGTIHFTSSVLDAVLPSNQAFVGVNGTESFTVILNTPGARTITVADVSLAVVDGKSNSVTVTALPTTATHLAVTLVSPAPPIDTGTPVTIKVTSLNGINETDLGDILHFKSSDPHAVLPPDTAFTLGANEVTFPITFETPGMQTVTVTDTARPSITGTVTVTVGAALDHFVVSGFPTNDVSGAAHKITVTAVDAYGNTVTTYSGVVPITSYAGFTPVNITLTKGIGTATMTLITPGTQTLTATASGKTGAETNLMVVSAATHLGVGDGLTPTAKLTAGNSITVTVTALTAVGKTDAFFADDLHITSSDKQAKVVVASNIGGVEKFTVTLDTAGSQTVTVTDLTRPAITGPKLTINVVAAGVSQLSVTGYPLLTLPGVCCIPSP